MLLVEDKPDLEIRTQEVEFMPMSNDVEPRCGRGMTHETCCCLFFGLSRKT
jgi:hypothetical protein